MKATWSCLCCCYVELDALIVDWFLMPENKSRGPIKSDCGSMFCMMKLIIYFYLFFLHYIVFLMFSVESLNHVVPD